MLIFIFTSEFFEAIEPKFNFGWTAPVMYSFKSKFLK